MTAIVVAADAGAAQAGASSTAPASATGPMACAPQGGAGAPVLPPTPNTAGSSGSTGQGAPDAQVAMNPADAAAQAMPDAQVAQAVPDAGGVAASSVLRIYADAQGNSHVEELMLTAGLSKDLPVSSVSLSQIAAGAVVTWHPAPARQFAVAIAGELEVEVSGGVRRAVPTGQLVFLEDTQGQGHITRIQSTQVTNMFLRVPANFDVVAWARGP